MKKQKEKSRKRPRSSAAGSSSEKGAVAKNGNGSIHRSSVNGDDPAQTSKAEEGVASIKVQSQKAKLSVPEKCDLIAELSESILESPESAFSSVMSDEGTEDGERAATPKGPSKMQQLITIASQQSSESEQYTAQLAIMSLLAIFIDILPSYRIRLPTTQEMAVKVSKDTKKVWDYERALLHHYQLYLKLLEKTWDKQKQINSHAISAVSVAALVSLAELLKKAFHFNFRSNLLTIVIRHMNNRQSEAIRTACCSAITHVFAQDAQGDVALEAARLVSKLIKDRDLKIHPDVLQTFLALPLRVHVDEAVAAKLAAQANAKKRKRDKETAEIEAELKEGHATVDKIVLARCQSDTLQAVALTYFRVLKSDNLDETHIQELLPPALAGLAKFAHLINIDTVIDLLGVLRDLLKKADLLPVDAALNCILTAFQTLSGPGKEMKIDQKEYILPLYNQLPRLCSLLNSDKHTEIVLQCLTAAFIQRRDYSTVRIAAFFKQILTTAMHTPSQSAIPLLAFARQLIQRFPCVQQMLENEQDVITEGQYMPDVEDPELVNPFATSAWELATLKFHWHSGIADQATSAATSKMLNMPSESPDKLRAVGLQDANDLFIPFVRLRKKHPLYSKQSTANGKSTSKRNQIRFVTPRRTTCSITET
jgi:nucleolar complex protein 3